MLKRPPELPGMDRFMVHWHWTCSGYSSNRQCDATAVARNWLRIKRSGPVKTVRMSANRDWFAHLTNRLLVFSVDRYWAISDLSINTS